MFGTADKVSFSQFWRKVAKRTRNCRSPSLFRSAVALSSLIRVSLRGYSCEFANFYLAIALVEPIFHVEVLATSLSNSRPEKAFAHFLVRLAEANVIALQKCKPTVTSALNLRQNLLRLLDKRWFVP